MDGTLVPAKPSIIPVRQCPWQGPSCSLKGDREQGTGSVLCLAPSWKEEHRLYPRPEVAASLRYLQQLHYDQEKPGTLSNSAKATCSATSKPKTHTHVTSDPFTQNPCREPGSCCAYSVFRQASPSPYVPLQTLSFLRDQLQCIDLI